MNPREKKYLVVNERLRHPFLGEIIYSPLCARLEADSEPHDYALYVEFRGEVREVTLALVSRLDESGTPDPVPAVESPRGPEPGKPDSTG